MSQAGEEEELEFGATACNSLQLDMLPLSAKDLQQATAKDFALGLALRHTREGWPQEVQNLVKSYFQRRQEISVDQGCLFLGSCVIIPTRYQEHLLGELHIGHQGIVKMKGLARSHVW